MTFYKKKSFYIIVAIIVLISGGVAYGQYKKANTPIQYETVKVKKGDVERTVDATGKVQSTNDLALRFEISGTITAVNVKEGDAVKKGRNLANLNLAQLNAAVAQASANLNQQLAGSTNEELNSYKAAVDSAKASWDKSKADTNSSIAVAESAVVNAKNNLKFAEGGVNSQIVANEYKDAVAVLQTSISILNNGLTEADNVLGIDNVLANDEFESYLSAKDTSKLNIAKNYYLTAKQEKSSASNLVLLLTTASSQTDIDSALVETESALAKMNQLLAHVSDALDATSPVGDLSQTELSTLKSNIATDRSAVTAQYTIVITQKQDLATAKTSYTTYSIAYDKAVKDLEITKQQASATVRSYEASYNQALANYNNKNNPPREVDVASYRAALSQAVANRNKAVLSAPVDGKIVKISKKTGEYVSASEVMFDMTAPHYEIEVDIPETDITKIKVNDSAYYTIDSLGDSNKFWGQVEKIDSKSTIIQDVVYYRVKIRVEDKYVKDYGFKPGMTANITIETHHSDEFRNVTYLPLRSVLSNSDGSRYVRVLKDNKMVTTTVQIGSRIDNGQVIITKGVNANEEVVLSVKQ